MQTEKLITIASSKKHASPNYFRIGGYKLKAAPLTHKTLPSVSWRTGEVIPVSAQRWDPLSATLYFYRLGTNPLVMGPPTWIYPREFKDRDFAGQLLLLKANAP